MVEFWHEGRSLPARTAHRVKGQADGSMAQAEFDYAVISSCTQVPTGFEQDHLGKLVPT
jgi:hypothetical protein